MELNICHLYPDLLNVYGDVGNVLILKHRAEERGIKVNIINSSINDTIDKDEIDIIFFGGGQDYEQSIVSEDLNTIKKDSLISYVEEGKVLLAICGGYQLLGKYYTAPNGEKINGLGVLNIYTEGGDTRFIGNTEIYNEACNQTYVGFENHSGRTYINDHTPLGKCIHGYGNNGEDGNEGCIYKNTFCSYFHGSFLSKNPEFADKLLALALKNKYGNEVALDVLDDNFEINAKKSIQKKLNTNS
ncbi:glutamine amidotransferase [Clostridium botulinum]|uniref:type 1 glutamine amidotransferase n=1 Tax=Clostridium botulinum TaxID=1491 RepID=UPI0013C88267|nr:type 1 glutamine amidotransferase [Clostridium botulinum]MBN1049266.1 glutamine amidotransferase [Clostridium botulinum]MBN1074988.1 glutamine amidotransferase [Clostridium botulinum]NFE74941.1 glutamine amidotransferase [Clostridium botulinum]NFL59731.1 glutamine amidotransferase [Clostridium botulinum]NFL62835.1 glutamine amidotransferase [Clostridium botulinum]